MANGRVPRSFASTNLVLYKNKHVLEKENPVEEQIKKVVREGGLDENEPLVTVRVPDSKFDRARSILEENGVPYRLVWGPTINLPSSKLFLLESAGISYVPKAVGPDPTIPFILPKRGGSNGTDK